MLTINNLANIVKALQVKLAQAEKNSSISTADLNELHEIVDSLSETVGDIQGDITSLEARLDILEAIFGTDFKITSIGGIAFKMKNGTGSNSVKGSVISLSASEDNAFILQANEYDAIGVVYESGIANGQMCWVVKRGIAEVLLKDGTGATHGNWVKCADTDGRADASSAAPSGGGFTNADQHFREIGHAAETKSSGTDVLCKIELHFL